MASLAPAHLAQSLAQKVAGMVPACRHKVSAARPRASSGKLGNRPRSWIDFFGGASLAGAWTAESRGDSIGRLPTLVSGVFRLVAAPRGQVIQGQLPTLFGQSSHPRQW